MVSAFQGAIIQKKKARIKVLTQTLHGTAIYAYIDPPGTTPTDRQSYGSPMERLGYRHVRRLKDPLVQTGMEGRARTGTGTCSVTARHR